MTVLVLWWIWDKIKVACILLQCRKYYCFFLFMGQLFMCVVDKVREGLIFFKKSKFFFLFEGFVLFIFLWLFYKDFLKSIDFLAFIEFIEGLNESFISFVFNTFGVVINIDVLVVIDFFEYVLKKLDDDFFLDELCLLDEFLKDLYDGDLLYWYFLLGDSFNIFELMSSSSPSLGTNYFLFYLDKKIFYILEISYVIECIPLLDVVVLYNLEILLTIIEDILEVVLDIVIEPKILLIVVENIFKILLNVVININLEFLVNIVENIFLLVMLYNKLEILLIVVYIIYITYKLVDLFYDLVEDVLEFFLNLIEDVLEFLLNVFKNIFKILLAVLYRVEVLFVVGYMICSLGILSYVVYNLEIILIGDVIEVLLDTYNALEVLLDVILYILEVLLIVVFNIKSLLIVVEDIFKILLGVILYILLNFNLKYTLGFFGLKILNYVIFLEKFIIVLDIIIPILIAVAFFTLIERKILASIQKRKGPNVVGFLGLLQPIADAVKLLSKETVLPSLSYKFIFVFSPIFTFVLSLVIWSVIPFNEESILSDINLGLLYIFAISSLGVYSIILAGWSSNSRYAFLGALRSSAQMISYEVSIGLILIVIFIIVGSLNLLDIVLFQQEIWLVIPLFPLFILFFISSLAETNRAPFDLPEAEGELVAGYNVEYSSVGFALFFIAEYSNIIFMSFLSVLLFFGGWNFFFFSYINLSIIFSLKLLFFIFLFVWVRSAYPRYRYDQLMRLGWKVFLPLSLMWVFFFSSIVLMFELFPFC